MSSCAEVLQRLDDYIDGELSVSEMELVRSHLSCCAECAAAYRRELHLIGLVRARLGQVAVPSDLGARLAATLRELSSFNPH